MAKEKYTQTELKIFRFQSEDFLTASGEWDEYEEHGLPQTSQP